MGDNRISFQQANDFERQRQEQLRQQAAATNQNLPKGLPEDDRQAVKQETDRQVGAIDDDKVVSSEALRQLGKEQGWNQDKLEKTIQRFDENSDGVFSEDEFDKLSAQMQSGDPTIDVQAGDSLSKLAADQTGDASKWKELYEANKDTIGDNPNLIQAGQQLQVPPKWTIDGAKIDPNKPTDANAAKDAELKDITTMSQAQSALDKLPQDDPQRPDYQAKVDQLQQDFDTKWPKPGATPATPASTPASSPASSTPAATPASSQPAGSSAPPASAPASTPASSAPAASTPASQPAGGSAPPAPDPEGGKLLQQLKDHPEQSLSFDQQTKVNSYVKATVDQQMAVANDPSKDPKDRLAAAQAADKTLNDATQAASNAGQNSLAESFTQKYQDAKVGETIAAMKIKTGDADATQKAIGDAGTDPGKLNNIINNLPDGDPRKEALGLIANGKVTGKSAQKIIDALKDQDNTRGDFAEALQHAGDNADVFNAVAAAAQYKATQNQQQGNKDTATEMQQLSGTMRAIAGASPGVRKELALGFDKDGNYQDYQRALDHADTKADVDALKAFVDFTNAQGDRAGIGHTFNDGEGDKLKTISDNFDALHANAQVWQKVQWATRDNDNTSRDIRDAAKNSSDPAALQALQTLAKQSGDNDLAVRLEVVRSQYATLSPEAKEKFLKDGHF